MQTNRTWLALFFFGLPWACGGTPDATEGPVGEARWEMLVGAEWSLEPGDQRYFCVRKTLEEDLWVQAFDALSPLGTHHTVLTQGEPDGPDGIVECDSFKNHDAMVYGSGVGSRPFAMPEGIAILVPKGRQLLLNLHLFNAGSETISGSSGVRFQALAEEGRAGVTLAEAVLMGQTSFTIPPGKHAVSGRCTLSEDATFFAVAPHMHVLGTHLEVVAHSSAMGKQTIFDQPYEFEDQQIWSLRDEVPMKAGDTVDVRCDYDNTTGVEVGFGESTLDEMCFAGIYRYPADPEGYFVCAQ
jgi:copper type II ascorbate-dependent monooxygenase-like protein